MIKDKPVIECLNLEKSFGKKMVLHDINLKMEEGTILALVGSNGAGKTTLLKILATLVVPSEGNAFINGRDITACPMEVKKMIGFVSSEERSFFWRLTGRQNLEFFSSLYNIGEKERKIRIDSLLEALNCEKDGNIRFREYSSGMKQILCIVRGMLHDPPILLMDEPTRSLSPDIAKNVRALIRKKAKVKGKTILIASHNMQEVERLADRIAIIDNGTIRAMGNMEKLKTDAGIPPTAELEAVFEHFTGRG
jgi:ABC-2 type transport system ATP-binding protein